MKNKIILLLIAIVTIVFNNSCKESNNEPLGKKRFTLEVDGLTREYYVHVPKGYNPKVATPTVFMLHGSGGNGEKFYNISGWKEVGEAENILTVFPSSAQYPCVFDDGVEKRNAEKWNSYDLELCDGTTPVDDIKFLSQVIESLGTKYLIDRKRIYMVGFSNGGEMASRAAIELSDQLVAVVATSGALPVDTAFTPLRKLPVLLMMGNADAKLLAKAGTTDPFPMDIDQLFSQFPLAEDIANVFVSAFVLDSNFITGGDPNTFVFADYAAVPPQQDNQFRFMLVKNMEHFYPNGKNHPMKAAEVHWQWMKGFQLP
jgi:polyhydroxybutyrate depolymerase